MRTEIRPRTVSKFRKKVVSGIGFCVLNVMLFREPAAGGRQINKWCRVFSDVLRTFRVYEL